MPLKCIQHQGPAAPSYQHSMVHNHHLSNMQFLAPEIEKQKGSRIQFYREENTDDPIVKR